MLHFLSINVCRVLLPATGILVGKLFKTLPVVSVYQTDNWLWGRADDLLLGYFKYIKLHPKILRVPPSEAWTDVSKYVVDDAR